jgi:hypothetical protein
MALLTGGLLAAVSSVLLGWNTWMDFLSVVRTTSGFFDMYGVVPSDMYNLRGTLALILGNGRSELINWISYAALGASALLTLWLWRGPWRPDDASFELRMALTILLGMLFSLHLNRQDGLILIAPAMLFYDHLRQRDLSRRAYAAFVILCPPAFLISEFTVRGSLGIRVPVLAMAVLALWMAKELYGEARAYEGEEATNQGMAEWVSERRVEPS